MGTLIKGFRQFNEEKSKSVVFTFGRFNPPTTGHEKLITKVASIATGNDYKIFASQSSDPKKNPLGYKEKVTLMRKIFSKHGRNIVYDKKVKNAIDALVHLYNSGYTKATMVVGADRISDFKTLLNKYNGVKARHGFYEFPDGISIVSAGDRDPDADDVSGMSASKMRAAAIAGDLTSFSKGLPAKFGDKVGVFNLLRKRMGLKEMTNFRKHIDLGNKSSLREKYISGEIFNINDRVLCIRTGIKFNIAKRKSTFVEDGDNNKYWIKDLVEVKQDKDIKDKKGTQPAKYFAKDAEGDEMSKSTKSKRDAHFKKGAAKSDDDSSAYKPAPGDKGAKTKPSKHTKKFKQMFGEEVLNEATKFKNLYHSSNKKIGRPSNKPMFFAIDIQHAAGDDSKGWYYNMIASGGTAYVYESKPKGKIAAYDDKKVQKVFEDNKVDFEEYVLELVANPSQSEIMKMEGTKLLEKNKYIGLQYFDYDPRDFSKDLEAVVIFNPAKNTSGFKKIKASNHTEKFKQMFGESKSGEFGTLTTTKKYKKDTPGQNEADGCWKGFKKVGMKKKGKKMVPNCVPESVQLDEKLITFANRAYPRSGHAVILAGGAGSGKGFILNNLIGLEGKVFDVDALKSLVLRAPKLRKRIKSEMGIDLKDIDLSKPKDVSTLHQVVGDMMKFPSKAQLAFFTDVMVKQPEDKPNVIFDVTLKDLRKLDNITRMVQDAGYDKKNIHIVWVVNDIEVAKVQNLDPKRGRVVPVEILVNTHRGASQTMLDIITMGKSLKKYMDGDIVFAFNKINVDSELKISKKGGAYIKDAEYFYAKRSGKAPLNLNQMGDRILDKISNYVPNANTWTLE